MRAAFIRNLTRRLNKTGRLIASPHFAYLAEALAFVGGRST